MKINKCGTCTFTVLLAISANNFLAAIVCGSDAQENQDARANTTMNEQFKAAASGSRELASLHIRSPRYQLHPGDALDIVFSYTPEFNQKVTIQPDGYISLTEIGPLQVAGKSVQEVSELIRMSYAKILRDPVVNIVLTDFEKPYFIASGELSHPGKYELRSDTTLTEAVAIAGGFTENSKHSEVFLFRRVANNWVELKKVDVKKMFKQADLSEDLHLESGDMVFVPQNRYSKLKRYIPSPGIGMTVSSY